MLGNYEEHTLVAQPILSIGKFVFRINELKSAGTFIDDVDILNQRIDELVGNTFTDDGGIDELQEKCDDLKDTKEALENILAVAA